MPTLDEALSEVWFPDYDREAPCYLCGATDPEGNFQRLSCQHYACVSCFLDGPKECPCLAPLTGTGEM